MQTGYAISGTAHAALISWVLFGGVFRSEPEPFEVTEVAVISSEAFAALTTAPAPATEVALPQPVEPVPEDAPEVAPSDPVTPAPAPEETAQPEPEEVPEAPPVQPEAEVTEEAPTPPAPPEDVAVLAPDVAPRPVPRPSERVAPEPVAEPEPEAAPDVVDQEAALPDDAPAETPQEEQEETAREEAADQIVTEAEELATAMTASLRPPRTRPKPPAPKATPAAQAPKPVPTPDPQPAPAPDDTAVDDALAEALGGVQDNVPQGPPLTAGEKDTLRVAVQACWNVGSLSTDALGTTVVVSVNMAEDGKPLTGSIQMLSSSGGSNAAAKQAFEAARRAIIRCGARGFDLPAEKYGQWKEIEMTFNPERMRIK